MGYGASIINNLGIIQIDQDFIQHRKVYSQYCNSTQAGYGNMKFPSVGGYINLTTICGIHASDGVPMIVLRPINFGNYVGGLSILEGNATNGNSVNDLLISVTGYSPFYLDVYSTVGTPISDFSTHGLEVYRGDGSIAYSSRHEQPRIASMIAKQNYVPVTATVSGFSSVPAFLANSLPYLSDAGSDYGAEWWYLAKAIDASNVKFGVLGPSYGPDDYQAGPYFPINNDNYFVVMQP
jgi:hypothetical protein